MDPQAAAHAEILTFAAEVLPGHRPVTVFCGPIRGEQIGDCFHVVDRLVQRQGGKRILGWQIWYYGFAVEAEFHAVWQAPSGLWLDVTPRNNPLPFISFLADIDARYDGTYVDNIRKALVDDPEVREAHVLAANRTTLLKELAVAEAGGDVVRANQLAVDIRLLEDAIEELAIRLADTHW